MSFSECSRVQLINCEHIVSNITFTFPFSAHRSAGWAGKKDSPTLRQHSSKQIDVHKAAATSFTTCHPPTITSLSPSHHQWKAVRSGQPASSARPSNMDHIFSHQTLEQTTITVIHPGRFDIKSTSAAPARPLSCCIRDGISHISF